MLTKIATGAMGLLIYLISMPVEDKISKEQRILLVMRKLLGSIVRETTPNPGMKHVLSENTREDIRMCFGLISARERELAEGAGINLEMRPRYSDQPSTSSVVSMDTLRKKTSQQKPENEDDE